VHLASIIAPALAFGATILAKKALTSGYRSMTGKEAPSGRDRTAGLGIRSRLGGVDCGYLSGDRGGHLPGHRARVGGLGAVLADRPGLALVVQLAAVMHQEARHARELIGLLGYDPHREVLIG
jgi:hypothetical protein